MNTALAQTIYQAFQSQGVFVTDIPALDNSLLQTALAKFLAQDEKYKLSFTQKHFNRGFDGYSYYGQKDSTHQAHDDQVYTLVISDFSPIKMYPQEFHNFLMTEWAETIKIIRELEFALMQTIYGKQGEQFYQNCIGHMVSANYYPALENIANYDIEDKQRLSNHIDVSLLTVMPYGVADGLIYQNSAGKWLDLPACNKLIIFPGYLLELYSNREIKAVNHGVKFPKTVTGERFSFNYFSLPYPDKRFILSNSDGKKEFTTSEKYFDNYLQLYTHSG